MSTKTEPPDPVSPSAESDLSETRDVELGLGEGVASEQLERIRSKLSLQDQSSRLPLRQLLIVFFGLAISLMLSFLDMTSVSTALPSMAREFDAAGEVSWVGTSFLIANTSMQILYGRLSDVFGRKVVLMSAIGLFAMGNLLCGFSQSMLQLICFRGLSGAGGGGIVSLTMIIVSDIVSLRERGKYQGMLGSAIAVGGGIGPLIGGVFAQNASWRWVFWFSVPISVLILIQLWFFLPLVKVSGKVTSKLKKIDYGGSLISLGANIFTLVAVSGGGVKYPWNSAIVIVMLTLGCILFVVFVLYEIYIAKIPIMPMHIFRIPSVAIILFQTFLVGIVYYGVLYYLPIFSQVLQHRSIIASGVLLLPLIITQTLCATLAGLILAKTGKYNPSICGGFAIWTVGLGLQTLFNPDISTGKIIGFLIIEGFGIGFTFQTTLVAAQATSPKKDRAVVTGARNFSRTIGGAFGLAICGAILNNVLASHLAADPSFSPELRAEVIRSSLALPDTLTAEQKNTVMNAYAEGIHDIFIMFVPMGAACFLMSLFVKDAGLPRDKPKEESATAPPGDVGAPEADPNMTAELEISPLPTPTEKIEENIDGGRKEEKTDSES